MTSPNDPTVQQMIVDRLDLIDNNLHESARELRDGQKRLEIDFHERLNRIERQTTDTNGRVTKLEAWEIASTARADAAQKIRDHDRTWVQPVITGVVTVLLAALFVALLNLDKL
jgi:hypothetical protein